VASGLVGSGFVASGFVASGFVASGFVDSGFVASVFIRFVGRAAKADVAAVNARKNGHRERSDVAAWIGGCAADMVVTCAASFSSSGKSGLSTRGSSPPASHALDWPSDRALDISFIATSPLADPCTTAHRHRSQAG
jgi:hypothetical protein